MKKLLGTAALALICAQPAFATQRIGLGMGAGWLGGGLTLAYDKAAVFGPEWSLGGEFMGGKKGYLVGNVRALYWENPSHMTGFFGGPKAFVLLGKVAGVAVGGEGGWLHRFQNKIDIGAGIDIFAGYDFGGYVKLHVGYLL